MADVLDTFTGTEGTYLNAHTPDSGGPWVVPSGLFPQWYTISGNKARSVAVATGGMYVAVGADVRVAAKLATTAGGWFMSLRMASGAADFSDGTRLRVNRLNNTLEVLDAGNQVIATVTPGTAVGTGEYDASVTHYRGHVRVQIGTDVLHGWLVDVLRGYSVPTGTHVGPDWSSTNDGTLDDLSVTALLRTDAKHISIIGDSISVFNRDAHLWPQRVAETLNAGVTQLRSRSQGGEGLTKAGASGLTASQQAAAILSSGDDPDYVLIHIGTNDDGQTQSAIQTAMAALLDTLTGGGIAASKIRVLRPLPMNPDGGAGAHNPDIAITRAGIAAACTSRGVTLWDTSTWIDPVTDTVDGIHPNATGSAKISAQVVSLLSVSGPPAQVTGLSATANSASQITLNWSNVAGEVGFVVERAPDVGGAPGTFAWLVDLPADTLSYANSGLAGGTRYWYRVRAYNDAGSGAYSSSASATTTLTPTLLSMVPTTAPAGTPGLTLVCSGSGFTPSTVVTWNGVARTTTYQSPTRVDATIPSGDLTTAGTATVNVQ